MGFMGKLIKVPFTFLCIFTTTAILGPGNDCPETRCSPDGPAVRFPFRLNHSQPVDCGYPGFDLYCKNKILVLQLPYSVKLNVAKIDYELKAIEAYDPEGCFPKQLPNLNIPTNYSPFKFAAEGDLHSFTLFNCSMAAAATKSKSWLHTFTVPCLGVPGGYTVRGYRSFYSTSYIPVLSCTKIYNTSSVPESVFSGNNVRIKLTWSIPKCNICEAKGKTCRLMNCTVDCFDSPSGIVVGVFLLVVAAVALYLAYKSYKTEKENGLKIKKFLEDYKALKPTRYFYVDLKRITCQFRDKVGEGGYGIVFKGKLSNETLVAVKILKNSSTGNGEDFINEMEIMAKIHHVNVARLVGFCTDGFKRAVVYEFLPNDSLDKFTSPEDREKHSFGWDKLQHIALGIAKGIEYLHQGCEQRILHFDIKPHNILLHHNFNPKIIDFSLAKLCAKERSAVTMTVARGTMGYIAPEVYSRNFGNVSYKSDVCSFGILLLEMVGGRKNTDVTVQNQSQVYFPKWVYSRLDQGNNIEVHVEAEEDKKIAHKLVMVGLWCIQWHPADRPLIEVVVQMLEGEGDSLTMPPNPFASMKPTEKMKSRFNSKLVVISESD